MNSFNYGQGRAMQYWWVNHKQTSKFEIVGGFLWSPMQKADGSRNQFYDNMRAASPGDVVISFSHAQIRHVGLVTDFAIPSPKPPSFGKTGENWDKKNGWLLPVRWSPLSTPVIPKDKILEFAANLPSKYSPIDPLSGKGRENAYLAEVSRDVYEKLIGDHALDFDLEGGVLGADTSVLREIDDAIEKEIMQDDNIDSTTKRRLIEGRLGQNVFKKSIYEFEACCRLRKIQTPSLLVASHIKPWRLCATAFERLDGANGLLLSPDVDVLFDRGLISFTDDGDVMVSPRVKRNDLTLLGLDQACAENSGGFHARQRKYLAFHREKIFLSY